MSSKKVATKTTYLQMFHPPAGASQNLPDGVEVVRLDPVQVEAYRYLYESVGRNYNWVDRTLMSDEQLKTLIEPTSIEVHVLQVDDQPAGFCELSFAVPAEVELVYFGLFPRVIGRGLGRAFLNWTIRYVFDRGSARFWLHTCDLDHPAALPNYQRSGFEVYDVTTVDQIVFPDASN